MCVVYRKIVIFVCLYIYLFFESNETLTVSKRKTMLKNTDSQLPFNVVNVIEDR